MSLEVFFTHLKNEAHPQQWTRGVQLAKQECIQLEKKADDEAIFRVKMVNQSVSPKVTLWFKEKDWYCDCREKQDPCFHVIACALSLKNVPVDRSTAQGKPAASQRQPHIEYRFLFKDAKMYFERVAHTPTGELIITDSLVSLVGGISSGRAQKVALHPTQDDFRIDSLLSDRKRGLLEPRVLKRLVQALASFDNVTLNNKPIKTSEKILKPELKVYEKGNGLYIERVASTFSGTRLTPYLYYMDKTLYYYQEEELPPDIYSFLRNVKNPLTEAEKLQFFTNIMDELKPYFDLNMKVQSTPKVLYLRPKVQFKIHSHAHTKLNVTPYISYGEPPLLEIYNQKEVHYLDKNTLVKRDEIKERNLIQDLQNQLQLQVGRSYQFEDADAFQMSEKIGEFLIEKPVELETFKKIETEFTPEVFLEGDHVSLLYTLDGETVSASMNSLYDSYKRNEEYTPLHPYGWIKTPREFLDKYADILIRVFSTQTQEGKLPKSLKPIVAQIVYDTTGRKNQVYEALNQFLLNPSKIKKFVKPKDLKNCTLRGYQEEGIKWLSFLKEHQLGGILADDMGLGKTLQTICVLEKNSLIIAPTSVIYSWKEQIELFRPKLKVCLFHGSQRKIDETADVFITSYGLIRQDSEFFRSKTWKIICVDESQNIKNPQSQVARIIHSLQSNFRVALSGTPIENRLEDLWSQFEFINPGLFESTDALKRGIKNVRPFILRRLKTEVAQELPEKTEMVLKYEFSENEQKIYDALLLTTQKEVLEKFEKKEGVLSALESLLRLRQACCHLALIPGLKSGLNSELKGQNELDLSSSSKVSAMIEKASELIENNHKILIFSQWTSFLDLLEKEIKKIDPLYLRLDGATRNRNEIVQKFQNNSNVKILLMSLKAGGVGLTLTAADHVFILDPWWNPAVEAQASDRAHRIGQTKPVFIHKFIMQNSIEEKIVALQRKKKDLAEKVLEGTETAKAISKEDILGLLSVSAMDEKAVELEEHTVHLTNK